MSFLAPAGIGNACNLFIVNPSGQVHRVDDLIRFSGCVWLDIKPKFIYC